MQTPAESTALNAAQAELIQQAARLIEQASAIIIAAGAGMGVDSGLPDFRGTEGFWQAYPALARAQIDFQSIANPHNFRTQPRLAWGFYGHRLKLYRETMPHLGFSLLKQWGESKSGGYFVYTSNVDGQFQKAGFDQNRIEECHGSIHHVQCLAHCNEQVWSAGDVHPETIDTEHCLWEGPLPSCPKCAALVRPNILMFNDFHWEDTRHRLQRGHLQAWLKQWSGDNSLPPPVIIELGAGMAIPSVRNFSAYAQKKTQGAIIRINPTAAQVSSAKDVGLAMGALAALNAMAAVLRSEIVNG